MATTIQIPVRGSIAALVLARKESTRSMHPFCFQINLRPWVLDNTTILHASLHVHTTLHPLRNSCLTNALDMERQSSHCQPSQAVCFLVRDAGTRRSDGWTKQQSLDAELMHLMPEGRLGRRCGRSSTSVLCTGNRTMPSTYAFSRAQRTPTKYPTGNDA